MVYADRVSVRVQKTFIELAYYINRIGINSVFDKKRQIRGFQNNEFREFTSVNDQNSLLE